ncbi:hypothetical protein F66182_10942 [Fusarium sp. NRRL 66182]|nr:hypothetical protein F66182_10942 [Fusarium sp. NRRL 66182]
MTLAKQKSARATLHSSSSLTMRKFGTAAGRSKSSCPLEGHGAASLGIIGVRSITPRVYLHSPPKLFFLDPPGASSLAGTKLGLILGSFTLWPLGLWVFIIRLLFLPLTRFWLPIIHPQLNMTDHINNSNSNALQAQEDDKDRVQPAPDMFDRTVGESTEYQGDVEKRKMVEGNAHFHRLGWKRLTVVLIVEAIALGCLSLPSAFATLGMVAGVILTVGLGFVAIYTSHVVGQVKLKFPEVSHYADAGKLLFGKFGYELVGIMFSLQLIFLVGSHCLTGTIAFLNLTDNGACSLVFGVVSAIILLLVAIPPSFAEVAILGYIDFVSIIAAVAITIIATGIQAGDSSPALLSAGDLISKVAFGVALPVIFISGSINTTVVGRYIHGRMFKGSIVRFINTKMGWISWLALVTVITIVAWIIAEAIPFFNDLLSISSSLFISGFTFYFPAIMWFKLIRDGPWYAKKNLFLSISNAIIFIIGMIVLVGGTYASIDDINLKFERGQVQSPFTCAPLA